MQLTPEQFHMTGHLLNDENSHLPLLASVLQRDLQGRIFVDDLHRIRSALIISRLDWVYFIGSNDCGDFKHEVIEILNLKSSGNYIWFGASDDWREIVKATVSKNVQDFPRFQNTFDEEVFRKTTYSPSADILPINEASLDTVLLKYYQDANFWDSPSNFLSKGVGFYIQDRGEIVSAIMSASVTETEMEIDIHTDESHRRKGYAEMLSRAFINACLSKGLLPKWDCYSGNMPSMALAEKLGFFREKQYPLIFITL